jgi:hypothetical protein
MRKDFSLSKREITHLIFLTGIKPTGYTVIVSGYAGCDNFNVGDARLGHAMVAAFRQVAIRQPALFPLSARPIKTPSRSRARSADVC